MHQLMAVLSTSLVVVVLLTVHSIVTMHQLMAVQSTSLVVVVLLTVHLPVTTQNIILVQSLVQMGLLFYADLIQ